MKHTILLLLVCCQICFGQEKKAKDFDFEPELDLYAIIPIIYGDNFLAQANEGKIGFAFNFYVLQFRNLKLGMGADFINNSVTDISRAGNIQYTRYRSVYGLLGYEIKLSKKIFLNPFIGIGGAALKFKSANRSFGQQNGNDYRVGLNVDYKIDKTLTAFLGCNHVNSTYTINTVPEFVSFYDHSKMVQITIGVKLN